MFWHLYRKEIMEHLTTFKFAAAFVTIILLSLASVWVLSDDYGRRRDTYNRLATETTLAAKECRVPSFIIPEVHYPPEPLSVFIQGKSKNLGNVVEISRWEVPRDASDSLTDNMLLAAQPSFDLLAIYTLVVSLFGILFTYDAITGERTRGTLRLLSAMGAGRARIYLAKFFGGVTVLFIPVAISMLGSLIILEFTFSISLTGMQWIGVLMILLAGLVYGAIFIALGLLCSSLLKYSQTSLALSLLIWAFVVILVPRLATSIAPSLYPLPSPSEVDALEKTTRERVTTLGEDFLNQAEKDLDNIGFWGTVGNNAYSNIIRWGTKDAFALVEGVVRFSEPLWQERAEQIWKLVAEHEREMKKQAEFTNAFNRISPAFLLGTLCTAIARTDFQTYDEFMNSARDYRRAFLASLRSRGYFDRNAIKFATQLPYDPSLSSEEHQEEIIKSITRLGGGKENRWEDRINESNWPPLPADIIPAFECEGSVPRFEETIMPFAVMIFIVLVTLLAGFVSFHRYDVR